MTQENEFVISVNRDPLFLRFVNRARDPPPPPPPPPVRPSVNDMDSFILYR